MNSDDIDFAIRNKIFNVGFLVAHHLVFMNSLNGKDCFKRIIAKGITQSPSAMEDEIDIQLVYNTSVITSLCCLRRSFFEMVNGKPWSRMVGIVPVWLGQCAQSCQTQFKSA